MSQRLKDKATIITGAARGIGKASAERFAAEGARLILVDQHAEEVERLAEQIRKAGGSAQAMAADVSNRSENECIVARCLEEFGRVDVLFCNAGVHLPKLLVDSEDSEIDRVLDVNVKSLIHLSRCVIPVMQDQGGGTILFTASKTGLVAQESSPIYCASKGAVVLLAKALALDHAPDNIRVNSLCPGIIDTPMLHEVIATMPDPASALQECKTAQPLGRLGTVSECANAALWLVSDEASFITGVALPIDGGFTAG